MSSVPCRHVLWHPGSSSTRAWIAVIITALVANTRQLVVVVVVVVVVVCSRAWIAVGVSRTERSFLLDGRRGSFLSSRTAPLPVFRCRQELRHPSHGGPIINVIVTSVTRLSRRFHATPCRTCQITTKYSGTRPWRVSNT